MWSNGELERIIHELEDEIIDFDAAGKSHCDKKKLTHHTKHKFSSFFDVALLVLIVAERLVEGIMQILHSES